MDDKGEASCPGGRSERGRSATQIEKQGIQVSMAQPTAAVVRPVSPGRVRPARERKATASYKAGPAPSPREAHRLAKRARLEEAAAEEAEVAVASVAEVVVVAEAAETAEVAEVAEAAEEAEAAEVAEVVEAAEVAEAAEAAEAAEVAEAAEAAEVALEARHGPGPTEGAVHPLANEDTVMAKDGQECPVCMERLGTNGERTALGCMHLFCLQCIRRHIETKHVEGRQPECPICKRRISPVEEPRSQPASGLIVPSPRPEVSLFP